jgi:hypothetical protein
MKCLDTQEFKNYWFETGTPTFLIELLRKKPIDPTGMTADESDFGTYDPGQLAALPLLVQTGYLTIKSAAGPLGSLIYKLGYPNREIELSFSRSLAQGFTTLAPEDITGALQRLIAALRERPPRGYARNAQVLLRQDPEHDHNREREILPDDLLHHFHADRRQRRG